MARVQRLFAPVDIAPLVWFRILFGALMVWEVVRYFSLGRIEDSFVAPAFHFSYYGFGWITPWPAWGMRLHFALMGLFAACVAMGAAYRLTAPLFFLSFCYVFLLDQAYYQNHLYLVCLFAFLLALAPAHRAFSIDAWRRPAIRAATVPAWSLWMLRAQLCVVYFMGGLAKINGDWLRGEPMREWLLERPAFPVIGQYFDTAWAPYVFSIGGLAVDLGVPLLLLFRRTRGLGFAVAVVFHVTNSRLFRIGIFPPLALGATLVLFSEDLPRPLSTLWAAGNATRAGVSRRSWPRHAGAALIGVWLAIQILVPLRHLAYPGNPEWTEEGHRFSWRMKLRDKDARLRLRAEDVATGRQWEVPLHVYLTEDQLEEASARPDMILQIAKHAAGKWRGNHGGVVAVYADAEASLNGRPLQALVDPAVNLVAEPRSLAHASWILPLTTPLPGARAAR